jgi:hypothetical protein
VPSLPRPPLQISGPLSPIIFLRYVGTSSSHSRPPNAPPPPSTAAVPATPSPLSSTHCHDVSLPPPPCPMPPPQFPHQRGVDLVVGRPAHEPPAVTPPRMTGARPLPGAHPGLAWAENGPYTVPRFNQFLKSFSNLKFLEIC